MKAPTAFQGAKSWHAEEHFSHGDVSMIRKGTPTKLPVGGMMSSKMIKQLQIAADPQVKQTVHDLGAQSLNGQSVHVHSHTVRGIPETLQIGVTRCLSRPWSRTAA